MKKATRILLAMAFVLSFSLVSMGVAQADYHNPPGWENNPYFTHQSWHFSTNANPSPPDVDNNPFGTAEYEAIGATWHEEWEGRSGVWQFDELSWVDFEVPNKPDLPIKEVWFQATYWTDTNGQISEDSWIYPDPLGDVTFARVSREEIGGGWYYETWMGTIIPQPELEVFTIFFDDGLEGPATVYVDQVDIDTRCVPIPGTLLLLGSGLVGFVVFGRRKVTLG
ncbi:MAG: hypothetical protein DRP73_05305 [Candidatus Omnitrophota bacterium]|nr:MAG: hypothetical protein DRP73_05305 [Candidatus Omnitrophota bacterium]